MTIEERMKKMEDAVNLAELLVETGKRMGKKVLGFGVKAAEANEAEIPASEGMGP